MNETLTYEQMMALFAKGEQETAKLRESIAEGRKETAELRASMAEETAKLRASMAEGFAKGEQETAKLRESMAEGFAESRKEAAELRASIDRLEVIAGEAIAEMRENTAQMKINSKNAGDLSNKIGSIIESIVLPGIVDKFNEKGFAFDKVSTRVDIMKEDKAGKLAELDALLENGKFVVALEAKTDMDIDDVKAHVKRLDALRNHSRFNGKKIYGAISTAIVKEDPVKYALEQGFYVLQQPDVTRVKILDFPKGHSAKAW